MNNESIFMHFYMFELEIFLNSNIENLVTVSFQSDEANPDRPLKEYLKSLIENRFNKLPSNPHANSLVLNDTTYSIDKYQDYKVKKVILPDEIDMNLKHKIMSEKTNYYTSPDMTLEISCNDATFYETIELKSTKNDSIPGSSVQQIIPEEWIIFVRHTANTLEISTGQYINSVNSKIQFPDRSPRPQVSFKELVFWNKQHRILENKKLTYSTDDSLTTKLNLISDWQGVLSKRWLDVVLKNDVTKNPEPWFNNTIRKFVLDFIKIYDKYNEEEKLRLKFKLKTLIQKNNNN